MARLLRDVFYHGMEAFLLVISVYEMLTDQNGKATLSLLMAVIFMLIIIQEQLKAIAKGSS